MGRAIDVEILDTPDGVSSAQIDLVTPEEGSGHQWSAAHKGRERDSESRKRKGRKRPGGGVQEGVMDSPAKKPRGK